MWGAEKLAIFIAAVWFRLLDPAPLFLLSFFLLAVRLQSFGFAERGRNRVFMYIFIHLHGSTVGADGRLTPSGLSLCVFRSLH